MLVVSFFISLENLCHLSSYISDLIVKELNQSNGKQGGTFGQKRNKERELSSQQSRTHSWLLSTIKERTNLEK